MPLPNFFIVGAMKAGTTSLYYYLREHPDAYLSPVKEPKFFAYDASDPEHQKEALKNFPITTMEAYLKLFSRVSNEKAIGEASVTYLRSRVASAAIRTHVPDAKIIISLRNPIDRAISLYTQRVRNGRDERELNEAFQTNEPWILSSLYHEDVKRYLETFGRNQVKILLFEEFKANSLAVVKDMFNFLDIDETFTPDISIHHNPGRMPRSRALKTLERLYKTSPRLTRVVRATTPVRLRRRITDVASTPMETTTLLSDDMRHRMTAFYHEDIMNLQDLIEIDLHGWLDEGARANPTASYTAIGP